MHLLLAFWLGHPYISESRSHTHTRGSHYVTRGELEIRGFALFQFRRKEHGEGGGGAEGRSEGRERGRIGRASG